MLSPQEQRQGPRFKVSPKGLVVVTGKKHDFEGVCGLTRRYWSSPVGVAPCGTFRAMADQTNLLIPASSFLAPHC